MSYSGLLVAAVLLFAAPGLDTGITMEHEPSSMRATGIEYEVGAVGPGGGVIFAVGVTECGAFRVLQSAPGEWYEGGDPLAGFAEAEEIIDDYSYSTAGDVGTEQDLTDTAGTAVVEQPSSCGRWRLPTVDELQQLFEARGLVPGLIAPSFYWSSTPLGEGYQIIDMFSGYREQGRREGPHRVRPVRCLNTD